MGIALAGAGILGISLIVKVIRSRERRVSGLLFRGGGIIAGVAGIVTSAAALYLTVPAALASTPKALERTAVDLSGSGAYVMSTLIIYDEFASLMGGAERSRIGPSEAELMQPAFRDRFSGFRKMLGDLGWKRVLQVDGLLPRYNELAIDMVGALHRAGVPIIAGTDAYGVPLVPPGGSLHAELDLLVEAGLTSAEALRAATVNPARFLGKAHEFGDVKPGLRADLVLVDENPLEKIRAMRNPAGVIIRGHWLSRSDLTKQLDNLR